MTNADHNHPIAVAERVRIVQWLRTAWLHPIEKDRHALADAILNGAHLVPPKQEETNDDD